jgi:hypothetical protein
MEDLAMPLWSRIAAGMVIAVTLLGFAGFQAYSKRLGPIVQTYGVTYYNGEGPRDVTVPCKPESEIRSAIARVHAKFDHFGGERLRTFEQAAYLKGLPPLNIDTLYVITEDDELRDGKTVLFIGLASNCVSTVFSFPARLYRELATGPEDSS